MRARKKYEISEAVKTAKLKASVTELSTYAEDLKPGGNFTLPSYHGGTITYTILGLFVNGHSSTFPKNHRYGNFKVMVCYNMELDGKTIRRSYPAKFFLSKPVNGHYRTKIKRTDED